MDPCAPSHEKDTGTSSMNQSDHASSPSAQKNPRPLSSSGPEARLPEQWRPKHLDHPPVRSTDGCWDGRRGSPKSVAGSSQGGSMSVQIIHRMIQRILPSLLPVTCAMRATPAVPVPVHSLRQGTSSFSKFLPAFTRAATCSLAWRLKDLSDYARTD